jgi:hypothetical protein
MLQPNILNEPYVELSIVVAYTSFYFKPHKAMGESTLQPSPKL